MARARDIEIAPVGDAAVLVRLGADVSLVTHARVMALLRALDRAPPAGLRDVVPAYTTALVTFDPLVTTVEAMEAHIHLALAVPRARARAVGGRLVRIPVWYGGEAGPDLDEVARVVGLPPDEVVRRHAAAEYHVYFVGFQAGFPYLGGLPAELAVPRLPNPRAFVPAGSVGLGGQQTGVYPVTAPGGWRLIGRTPMRIFDPMADPPALLRPGDRVRFEAIQGGEAGDVTSEEGSKADQMAREHRSAREGHVEGEEAAYVPWLRVRRPGPMATVQDLGRQGCARYGVSASGAADADALMLGNALLGNPFGAAGLELTLGGGELEVMAPCLVALTGAECEVRVGGGTLKSGVVAALAAGDVLQNGATRRGARVYLCVAGGVGVRAVLGSRSTDLRAGLGGIEGRALRAGDVLMRGAEAAAGLVAGRELPGDPVRRFPANGAWRVRVLAGPHAAGDGSDLEALLAGAYTVDLQSDRVGVRLRTASLPSGARMRGGDIISEGVPRGAIQVPANGEPIILLADHQTTGGYRVPAVVAGADLWRVAQMRPGDTVRFTLVTRGAALAAWRARQEWLQRLAGGALGIAGAPDVGRLMRGFAEWSEEAYDEA